MSGYVVPPKRQAVRDKIAAKAKPRRPSWRVVRETLRSLEDYVGLAERVVNLEERERLHWSPLQREVENLRAELRAAVVDQDLLRAAVKYGRARAALEETDRKLSACYDDFAAIHHRPVQFRALADAGDALQRAALKLGSR